MSCQLKNTGGATIAVLQFEREQLLYDIRNYCYVEGHIMPSETEAHARHTVQDVGEEGNVDRVTRVLDLAVSECRELLYSYTRRAVKQKELNDKLRERSVYGIVMRVPDEFSQTTLVYLERLIHEYLVCKGVADWLSITNPQKSQIWEAKAQDARNAVSVSLAARTGRTRRRVHPF